MRMANEDAPTSADRLNSDDGRWKKWKKAIEDYDDDDEKYLSRETIRRREDRKLLDYITSTLYRLEMDMVKPSFDVKMQAGLHRGPFRSARGKRDYQQKTSTGKDSGRGQTLEKGETEYGVHQRPTRGRSTEDLRGSTKPGSSQRQRYIPITVPRRPYITEEDEIRYATLPGRWLSELNSIDADARQHSERVGSASKPTWLTAGANGVDVRRPSPRRPETEKKTRVAATSEVRAVRPSAAIKPAPSVGLKRAPPPPPPPTTKTPRKVHEEQDPFDDAHDELLNFLRREERDEKLQQQQQQQGSRPWATIGRRPATSVTRDAADDEDASLEMLMDRPFGYRRRVQNNYQTQFGNTYSYGYGY